MMAARKTPAAPEPGIYQLAGHCAGQEAWIAYDATGEFEIRVGEGAYGHLELWLRERGVKLPVSRPVLFLAR